MSQQLDRTINSDLDDELVEERRLIMCQESSGSFFWNICWNATRNTVIVTGGTVGGGVFEKHLYHREQQLLLGNMTDSGHEQRWRNAFFNNLIKFKQVRSPNVIEFDLHGNCILVTRVNGQFGSLFESMVKQLEHDRKVKERNRAVASNMAQKPSPSPMARVRPIFDRPFFSSYSFVRSDPDNSKNDLHDNVGSSDEKK